MSMPTQDTIWKLQVHRAFIIQKSIKCIKSRSTLVYGKLKLLQRKFMSILKYMMYQEKYAQANTKKLSCYFPNFFPINQSIKRKQWLFSKNLRISIERWQFIVNSNPNGYYFLCVRTDLALRSKWPKPKNLIWYQVKAYTSSPKKNPQANIIWKQEVMSVFKTSLPTQQ